MNAGSPLVFRPNLAQRAFCVLLCAGSWIVGIRTLKLLLERMPSLLYALKLAHGAGEPTLWLRVVLVSAVAACFVGGLILLLSLMAMLLVEGTSVLVDELGISVDCSALPPFLAKRLGAGRLTWKEVTALEKRGFCFVLRGGGKDPDRVQSCPNALRFILVDELERLIHLILERSPNLRF